MSASEAIVWWLFAALGALLLIAGAAWALGKVIDRFEAADAGREE